MKNGVDLHLHLDGSLTPAYIIRQAKKQGLELPAWNEKELERYLTAPKDCRSLNEYLEKFHLPCSVQRFAELGKKGVLALMCDSTNAERRGFTPSERTVGKTFDEIFEEHKNTRIIIATFASNVDRVQQIINSAYKFGRKVVVEGRSMVNIIEVATNLGCLSIPDKTLIDIEQLKNYPDEKTVIITTGSQGESMAALSRMAEDNHKKISIGPRDTVIFSSNPIPGNEQAVYHNIACGHGSCHLSAVLRQLQHIP